MIQSPYENLPVEKWEGVTRELVKNFPLSSENILYFVDKAWNDLFNSRIGTRGLKIGLDIILPAQAMGVLLERLIAVEMQNSIPGWRGGNTKNEKDIVCTINDYFSFEIKTSSSVNGLYGNRSTGNLASNRTKFRSGYYLVINYKNPSETDRSMAIYNVRFGWIDDSDWVGQSAQSGQQASIGVGKARLKLITIMGNI